MVATPDINYVAVIAAAASSMFLGMIWYGPLFGKQWMSMMGITLKSMKNMKMTPKKAMTLGALGSLVTSFVLAHFVDYMEATSVPMAIQTAFWIWLGFVATVQLGVVLWEGKSWKLFWLNTLYNLVSLSVMASILAVWN